MTEERRQKGRVVKLKPLFISVCRVSIVLDTEDKAIILHLAMQS